MTNQNNELRVILEDFAEDLAEIPEGSKLEDIYDLVKSAHQTAEKAIQALYAPKPVENGELREKIADIFDDLCEPTNQFWHRESGLYYADKVLALAKLLDKENTK